jgi:hypothetical protein
MKVYTTPEFYDAVKELSLIDRRDVFHVFRLASSSSIKAPSAMPLMKVVIDSGDKKILEIRNHTIRVFTTVEKIQGNDSMVFIGVEKGHRNRARTVSRIRNEKRKIVKSRK